MPFYHLWLDNSLWQKIQIMKLLIVKFSLAAFEDTELKYQSMVSHLY
jgi:hypothetical protein